MFQKLSLLTLLFITIFLSPAAFSSEEVKSSKPNIFEEAIIESQKKLELNPHNFGAYYQWGLALGHLGKYEESIEKFKKVVEMEPRLPAVYLNWGVALSNLGQYDEALEEFNRVINFYPKNTSREVAEAYLNWGIILAKSGMHTEAIEKYKISSEINKSIVDGWDSGSLRNLKQNYVISDDLHSPAGLKLELADSYFNCGLALRYAGRSQEAIEMFKKAVEINPMFVDSYLNWGEVLYYSNKYEDAVEKYKKTIEIDPSNAKAYFNWGKALYSLDRYKYDRAIEKFKRAVELSPENTDYLWELAMDYRLLGKKEESIKYFKIAKKLYEKQGNKGRVEDIEHNLKDLEAKH